MVVEIDRSLGGGLYFFHVGKKRKNEHARHLPLSSQEIDEYSNNTRPGLRYELSKVGSRRRRVKHYTIDEASLT